MKMKGVIAFESWEVTKLNTIRLELASHLTNHKTKHLGAW
jgi:hypothetical protein